MKQDCVSLFLFDLLIWKYIKCWIKRIFFCLEELNYENYEIFKSKSQQFFPWHEYWVHILWQFGTFLDLDFSFWIGHMEQAQVFGRISNSSSVKDKYLAYRKSKAGVDIRDPLDYLIFSLLSSSTSVVKFSVQPAVQAGYPANSISGPSLLTYVWIFRDNCSASAGHCVAAPPVIVTKHLRKGYI